MEREGSLRRSLHRLKYGGSSSSLTELSDRRSEKGGTDESSRDKGTQQRRAGANATWNSIHNAVISVFQRKELGENELYNLNEGVRQLLKTELGSFFTEYLQNQLLTKGMVILRDKIHFYEGQKLLDSLAETWDFFFCDVLSMLQAIFYPVQGKEPSVRQLALLHFRNIITLNLKLDEALSRPKARVPAAIIQMLLILQGVHESPTVTADYLKLECLIERVVSPYLGTHGLYCRDTSSLQQYSACVLEQRFHRGWPSRGGSDPLPAKNPVVRSKSYNVPMLTPLVEYDVDSPTGTGSGGIRRHSVCEMTSCAEESCSLGLEFEHLTNSSDFQAISSPPDTPRTPRTSEEDDSPHLPHHLHLLHSPCLLPELSLGPGTPPGPDLLPSVSRASPGRDRGSAPSVSSSSSDVISESSGSHESRGIFLEFPRRSTGHRRTQSEA